MLRSSIRTLASAGFAFCLAIAAAQSANAADVVRVGEGPFITGGGFYVANERGYFKKMGLDIQVTKFNDGALAVPAILAGELDITLMTANASFFNSVAKGAPLVIVLDRGHNRPGYGYLAVNVTQELYDEGCIRLPMSRNLKARKMGVGALGSINQYDTARALQKAGLDPRKDVTWIVGVSQPDLMKMLGQKQVDLTDLAYQFGFFAQNNKWGPIVANGDHPPEEPPAVRETSHGLRAVPWTPSVVPNTHSSGTFVSPTTTAPGLCAAGPRWHGRLRTERRAVSAEPTRMASPRTPRLSLTATGTPASASSPRSGRAATSSASASAASARTARNAPTRPSSRSIRARSRHHLPGRDPLLPHGGGDLDGGPAHPGSHGSSSALLAST